MPGAFVRDRPARRRLASSQAHARSGTSFAECSKPPSRRAQQFDLFLEIGRREPVGSADARPHGQGREVQADDPVSFGGGDQNLGSSRHHHTYNEPYAGPPVRLARPDQRWPLRLELVTSNNEQDALNYSRTSISAIDRYERAIESPTWSTGCGTAGTKTPSSATKVGHSSTPRNAYAEPKILPVRAPQRRLPPQGQC